MACAIWRVEDLVIEYREVEGKTKTDGMCGGELGLCDISCGLSIVSGYVLDVLRDDTNLVSIQCLISSTLALGTSSEFGKITVVVSFPVRVSEH